MELLNLVDIGKQAHKLPSMLSGGQQQRVAIARALANDPPIIVADEPTGNLDSRTAWQVFELFETLVNRGKTLLMVTHDDTLKERVRRKITIVDGELADPEPEPQHIPHVNGYSNGNGNGNGAHAHEEMQEVTVRGEARV
jgi:putative ABC transport system ATP-binding protein